MLAAGVPMLRLAAPIMLAGVIANGLLVVDQELVIPHIVYQLMRARDEVSGPQRRVFGIRAMEDQDGSLLMVARYTAESADGKQPATMEELDIIERDKSYEPVAHIEASGAWYDAKAQPACWRLQNGKRMTGLRGAETPTQTSVDVWQTSITPAEIAIYRRHNVAEYLAFGQINDLLQRPRNYGTVPLLRVRNWRLAQPLANVVLLLLAIPCVLTRDPAGLKWSATRTLLLTGGCLCTMFVAHQLAGSTPQLSSAVTWTSLLLWMPIFIFGPIAVVLLDRVKT
jgi:lipopolysaccharide export LptBFGC system permease protein LptF